MTRVVVALLALALLAAPLGAEAQYPKAGKIARIGRLSPLSAETDAPNLEAFRKGLRDLGWVDGQHFTIEARFADGRSERLSNLAAELVRRGVDVILTGSNAGALAARHASNTIPPSQQGSSRASRGRVVTSRG